MKKTWHRVRAPIVWQPKIGDELIGEYLGSNDKIGQFGNYKVHLIKIRGNNIRKVSGTIADSLFEVIEKGTRIKLIFSGVKKASNSDRMYKIFELFTEQNIEIKLWA